MKKYDKLILVIGSVAIVTAVGFGCFAFMGSSKTTANNISQPTSQVVKMMNKSTVMCRDGNYNSAIIYNVHGSNNSINVSLTISGGVISSLQTSNSYSDKESKSYVDSFESGVNTAVVGKPISSANFSRIGGASATTKAFQKAIETIRSEASV